MPSDEIRLIAKGGSLYYPDSVLDAYGEPGPIVLVRYEAGDCDTFEWPLRKPGMKELRTAVLDDAETGLVEDHRSVTLPDGRRVF